MISLAVDAVVQVVQVSDGAIQEALLLEGRGLQDEAGELASGRRDDGIHHELVTVVDGRRVEHVTHQQPRVVAAVLVLLLWNNSSCRCWLAAHRAAGQQQQQWQQQELPQTGA